MNRTDFRFLAQAFELTLNRRRFAWQAWMTAGALLLMEMAAGLSRLARLPDGIGWLLAFPLAYAALMAAGVVSCAACRHAHAGGADARAPFDAGQALLQGLLPAASGSMVFFLASAAICLVSGILLGVGKLHPVVVGVLAAPLSVLLAAALVILVFGLLLFPPLAAVSGGRLDEVFSRLGDILRQRLLRVLSQLGVAILLAALFTLLLLAFLWGGQALLEEFGGRIFASGFAAMTASGPGGFLYRMEMLALLSAVLAPGLLFLNAASGLVLSSAGMASAAQAPFDEEEETWLQP